MTQICIISGSTLGSAEYVAEHLESVLSGNYQVQLMHGPQLDEVIEQKLWLIVTSTHGAGELPENIQPLFEQIEQSSADFTDLRFAVIGLGNSDYDTFCYGAETAQRILLEKGAKLLCPMLKIDVLTVEDNEQFAEDWLPNFTQKL